MVTKNSNLYENLLKLLRNNYNFYYSSILELDYNTGSSCNYNNCDSICRHNTISDLKIQSFDYDGFCKFFYEFTPSAHVIDKYCIDRMLKSLKLTSENFTPETIEGYYGDEISGIYLEPDYFDKIFNNINELSKLNYFVDKIHFILKLEYGYVLDSVKPLTGISVEDIDVRDIKFNDVYRKKIDIQEDWYNTSYTLPRGIFIYLPEERKYRLIDGYHRTCKAIDLGMEKISALVLKSGW